MFLGKALIHLTFQQLQKVKLGSLALGGNQYRIRTTLNSLQFQSLKETMSVKSQERLGNEGKNGLQIFELSEKRKLSYILNSHLIQVRKPNLVIINKELSVNRRHWSR